MIQEFVDRFMAGKEAMIAGFTENPPLNYVAIFTAVVSAISAADQYDTPDPSRIVEIDHGYYQGTRLFVVAATGYQPSTYWACAVSYGSCSGCDTFEAIYDGDPGECAQSYWTLALHMVQRITKVCS